jgi:hypothetical protein
MRALDCDFQFILSILFPTDVTYRVRKKTRTMPNAIVVETQPGGEARET